MIKKWLFYLSPCVLASIFLLVIFIAAYIDKEHNGDWSMMPIVIGMPYFIGLIVIDIIVKFFCKRDLVKIWIIEIVILLLVVYHLSYYLGY